MKKRLLCVLLVVLLCLPGCKPDQSLEGTWTAEVDALQAVLGKEVSMLPLSVLPVTVTMTLTGEGTFTFTVDRESIQKAVDALWQKVQKLLEGKQINTQELLAALEGALGENLDGELKAALEGALGDSAEGNLGDTLEGALGVTTDKLKELLQELLENADIEQKVAAAYDRSGTYTDDGKQLVLTDSEGNTFLSGKYLRLGKKLTVTAPFPGTAVLIFQQQN